MNVKLTADRLRQLLDYDPETGVFVWRCSTNRRIKPGMVAGTECRGRIQIRVGGGIHRAHRLAWLYVTGEWPRHEIDHINGNPSDNRFDNLRDVTHNINIQNQYMANKRNLVGLLGVSKAPQKRIGYRARIDGIHLGTFKTPEEAHQVYIKAKRERHEGSML